MLDQATVVSWIWYKVTGQAAWLNSAQVGVWPAWWSQSARLQSENVGPRLEEANVVSLLPIVLVPAAMGESVVIGLAPAAMQEFAASALAPAAMGESVAIASGAAAMGKSTAIALLLAELFAAIAFVFMPMEESAAMVESTAIVAVSTALVPTALVQYVAKSS